MSGISLSDGALEVVSEFSLGSKGLALFHIDPAARQIIEDTFDTRNLQCKLDTTPFIYPTTNPSKLPQIEPPDAPLQETQSLTQEFDYCSVCPSGDVKGKEHFGCGEYYIDTELVQRFRVLGLNTNCGRVCSEQVRALDRRYNQSWAPPWREGVDPQRAFAVPLEVLGWILRWAEDEEVLSGWMCTCKAFCNAGADMDIWLSLVRRRLGPRLVPPDAPRPILPHVIGSPRYLLSYSRTLQAKALLLKTLDASSPNRMVWEAAMRALPERDCRYMLLAWKPEVEGEGQGPVFGSPKKIFIMYCPERAPPRSKIYYGSAKDTIRRSVVVSMEMNLDEKYSYSAFKQYLEDRCRCRK